MKLKRFFIVTILLIFSITASSINVFAAVKPDAPVITGSNIVSSGKNRIKWQQVSGASYYRIYRSKTKSGGYERIESTSSLSYSDGDAKAGEAYYYCVKAVSSDKVSSQTSNKVKLTRKLSCPELLLTKVASDGDVTLSWKLVSGAKYYRIYRSESKASGYTRLATTSKRTYTDTTASAGKTYYYKVRATYSDSAANSAYSQIFNIKILKTSGFAVGLTMSDDDVPSFVWNSVSGAESYRIYRSLYSNKKFSRISTRTVCNYTNESVPKGLTLYYKIVALNSSGTTLATSKVIKITTEPDSETLKTRYVNKLMIYLYELPDSDSQTVSLRYMDKIRLGNCVLTRTSGKWYRVFYNGELYFLWTDSIKEAVTYAKSSFEYTGNTVYQQEVIDMAVDIALNLKTTYIHGQSDGIPDSDGVYGFDCSGFVKYVLDSVMTKYNPAYGLSADVEKLYATTGVCNAGYTGEYNAKKVSIDNLQPGDILFFTSLADGSSSDSVNHCGIYLGNNEFAHSTSYWEDAVCIVPLSDSYLENFAGARRYLPTSVSAANEETEISGPYYNYKLYSEKSVDSDVVKTLSEGDTVTVLFTDSEKWAYIETSSGVKGFIFLKYLA